MRIRSPHSALIAVLGSLLVACAHPHAPAGVDGVLVRQLVAWDLVRQRAERNELRIRLPNLALREHGFEPVVYEHEFQLVVVPRLSPHFVTVAMEWPRICERRGVLAPDVFDYAMAWCRYVRDGQGDLKHALVGFIASPVPGLRAAALDDLVNVVADAHDAATAMRVLARVTLPADTLAKLAAIYSGLGREDDADVVRAHLPPLVVAPACSELNAALETFVPKSLITIREVAAGSSDCASLARAVVCRMAAVSADAMLRHPMCDAPVRARYVTIAKFGRRTTSPRTRSGAPTGPRSSTTQSRRCRSLAPNRSRSRRWSSRCGGAVCPRRSRRSASSPSGFSESPHTTRAGRLRCNPWRRSRRRSAVVQDGSVEHRRTFGADGGRGNHDSPTDA